MGAPKGNNFWLKRNKHGRDKKFKTPEILEDACFEYLEETASRVWEETQFKGADVVEVKVPTSVPFSIRGLCVHLGVYVQYFTDFENALDVKNKEIDKAFSLVIKKVRCIIEAQQIEGAAVGAFKENIISRLIGLTDKKEVTKHKTFKFGFKDGKE